MPTTIGLRKALCDKTRDGRIAAELHRSAAHLMRIGEDDINIEVFLEHVYELQLMLWIARRCHLPNLLPGLTGPQCSSTEKADEALTRIAQRAQGLLHKTCADCDGVKAYKLWRPILEAASSVQSITPIFTLNYDWTFEKLAIEKKRSYRLVDGFELLGGSWNANRLKNIKPAAGKPTIALYKLHGSTNWLPGLTKSLGTTFDGDAGFEGAAGFSMIYPAHQHVKEFGKESWYDVNPKGGPGYWESTEPYHTLHKQLAERVRKARLIVVIGYAFGDHRVNEQLAAATKRTRPARILVVDPGDERYMNDERTKQWAPPFGRLEFGRTDEWRWSQVTWLQGRFGDASKMPLIANAIRNPESLEEPKRRRPPRAPFGRVLRRRLMRKTAR